LFVHSWVLQIAVTVSAAIYLGRWRLLLHQRRRQSWEALLSRLIPGWQAPAAGEPSAAQRDVTAERVSRSAKLWNLNRNAQTMQEIADYALRNFEFLNSTIGHAVDRSIAEELHRDATYLRFLALAELAQYALGRPAKTSA
jgi:hypothetical protein